MDKFTVRPYHGRDCDSDGGFNNGSYLESIVVDAADGGEACGRAMGEYLRANVGVAVAIERGEIERDGSFGENTLYWEYGHTDHDGNEVSAEAWRDMEDEQRGGYLYQYIDFNTLEWD